MVTDNKKWRGRSACCFCVHTRRASLKKTIFSSRLENSAFALGYEILKWLNYSVLWLHLTSVYLCALTVAPLHFWFVQAVCQSGPWSSCRRFMCKGDTAVYPMSWQLDACKDRTEFAVKRGVVIISSHARSFPSFRDLFKAWITIFNVSTYGQCQNSRWTCV